MKTIVHGKRPSNTFIVKRKNGEIVVVYCRSRSDLRRIKEDHSLSFVPALFRVKAMTPKGAMEIYQQTKEVAGEDDIISASLPDQNRPILLLPHCSSAQFDEMGRMIFCGTKVSGFILESQLPCSCPENVDTPTCAIEAAIKKYRSLAGRRNYDPFVPVDLTSRTFRAI